MSEADIYQKIQNTYKTESGKKFISHLIRAFFPADKAHIMFGFEEKRELKCCLTNEKLYTKDDLFQLVVGQSPEKAIFAERIMLQAQEILGGEKKEASAELLHFEAESLKIKKNLAIYSEQSDKVMSQLAWRELFNFTSTELLRGNGHINWLLGNERAKLYVKDGREKGWITTDNEAKVVEKVVNHARLSLGENETLKRLKDKLEKGN